MHEHENSGSELQSDGVSEQEIGPSPESEKQKSPEPIHWADALKGDSDNFDFIDRLRSKHNSVDDFVLSLREQDRQIAEYKAMEKDMFPLILDSPESKEGVYRRLGKPISSTEYLETEAFKELQKNNLGDEAAFLSQLAFDLNLPIENAVDMVRKIHTKVVDAERASEEKLNKFFHENYGSSAKKVLDRVTKIIPVKDLKDLSTESIDKIVKSLTYEAKYGGYNEYSGYTEKELLKKLDEELSVYARTQNSSVGEKIDTITARIKDLRKNKL